MPCMGLVTWSVRTPGFQERGREPSQSRRFRGSLWEPSSIQRSIVRLIVVRNRLNPLAAWLGAACPAGALLLLDWV